MAVTRKQKEATLNELVKLFTGAKSVIFSQYQGTNVKNMRSLRKRLLEKKVKFKVARKTLMTLAVKKVGFEQIPDAFLEGPIGLAFGLDDAMVAPKLIHEFSRECETIKMCGGIFEGKFIDADAAKELALLPPREVLLAKLLGTLKAPIVGFHAVLYGLLRNFVFALSEIQKKKV